VPHVLRMATGEVRDPVAIGVLVKGGDLGSAHGQDGVVPRYKLCNIGPEMNPFNVAGLEENGG
jgi:hypothetical protein